MQRNELVAYLDRFLEVGRFRDYCPNGLQVEGRASIRKVVCGVTASQALLDEAMRMQADAVLVHHGYFWRGDNPCVTGLRKSRLETLLKNEINLLAYHLPLDAHHDVGNNAQLARAVGWEVVGRFGDQEIGFTGRPSKPVNAGEISSQLATRLGRDCILVGDGSREVHSLAWCTGGAQHYFEQAIDAGVDLFVSGEISEQTTHFARESGIPYIAAGHHATERYGIQALARHLQDTCGLSCCYVEIDNPA